MIPQVLPPSDLFALARAFCGLPTTDLSVQTPFVAEILKTIDWRNPQQVGIAQNLLKDHLPAILAMNPNNGHDYLTVINGSGQPQSHLILADDLKHLPPPRYALDRYPIYLGSLNALVGPSGAGKSFVAVDIAGLMATAGAQVVYIAGEGLFGYSARWEVWKAHNNLKNCPNLIFYDRPVNFLDPVEMEKFFNEISINKPDMVIVDTVARCMGGADENSTRDMNAFVASCDRITHTFGSGVLVVHHTGKDGKMRGSTALFGACDSVLFLQRDETRISIHNSLDFGGKNKHSEEAAPQYVTLVPQTAYSDDKQFDSAVLVESEYVVQDKTSQLKPRDKMVLETLEGHENGLTSDQILSATRIPRSSIYRLLARLKKSNYISENQDKYLITDDGLEALGY